MQIFCTSFLRNDVLKGQEIPKKNQGMADPH